MSIKYTNVDEQTKRAFETVREELDQKYRNELVELEKRAVFGDKVKEDSSFYDISKATMMPAFSLMSWCADLDEDEIGRLQGQFLKKFPFYNLFAQKHINHYDRGNYNLMVIRNYSTMRDPNEDKIPRSDHSIMRSFVEGFIAARKAYRPKRKR